MLTGQRGAIDSTSVAGQDAGIGRAAVTGALVGFVVVLTLVSGIALAAGAGLIGALGVGAFAALWGGPGWGGMVGAVRHADRIADDERHANWHPVEADRHSAEPVSR
ncbi:MAG: hypothetical protein ACRDZ3_20375 [Acidimicrobiia bacterium]